MEGQQQVEQSTTQHEKMSSSTSSYLCRQSSTRWTPTAEQIKLLKELYYINGVRSPTADQIQAICARLRRYGKIEGKNVFYWFQNHKARERQKKRLTPISNNSNNNNNNNNVIASNGGVGINCWKQDEVTKYPCINTINNNNNNSGMSCSSTSAGVVSGGGQLMGNFGYGAVTMENKFRDCSISGGFNGTGNMNTTTHQWTSSVGGTPNYNTYATYPNFHDKISAFDEDHEQQDHYVAAAAAAEIETLPLFPMHDKDNDHGNNNNNNNNNNHFNREYHFQSAGFYTGSYRWSSGGGNGASLELSLNSYGYGCYSHNY